MLINDGVASPDVSAPQNYASSKQPPAANQYELLSAVMGRGEVGVGAEASAPGPLLLRLRAGHSLFPPGEQSPEVWPPLREDCLENRVVFIMVTYYDQMVTGCLAANHRPSPGSGSQIDQQSEKKCKSWSNFYSCKMYKSWVQLQVISSN